MGRISDKHRERKEDTSNPLSGGFGKTKRDTNDFDIDSDTIKDQQKKK